MESNLLPLNQTANCFWGNDHMWMPIFSTHFWFLVCFAIRRIGKSEKDSWWKVILKRKLGFLTAIGPWNKNQRQLYYFSSWYLASPLMILTKADFFLQNKKGISWGCCSLWRPNGMVEIWQEYFVVWQKWIFDLTSHFQDGSHDVISCR